MSWSSVCWSVTNILATIQCKVIDPLDPNIHICIHRNAHVYTWMCMCTHMTQRCTSYTTDFHSQEVSGRGQCVIWPHPEAAVWLMNRIPSHAAGYQHVACQGHITSLWALVWKSFAIRGRKVLILFCVMALGSQSLPPSGWWHWHWSHAPLHGPAWPATSQQPSEAPNSRLPSFAFVVCFVYL